MVRTFAALLACSLLVTRADAQDLDATARLMRDLTEAPGSTRTRWKRCRASIPRITP